MLLTNIAALITIAAAWMTIFTQPGQTHNIAFAVFVVFTFIFLIMLIRQLLPRHAAKPAK